MADKTWNIMFTFPMARAAHAQQFASVKASNLGLALNRAFKEVKQKNKGLRISEGKCTFTVEANSKDCPTGQPL